MFPSVPFPLLPDCTGGATALIPAIRRIVPAGFAGGETFQLLNSCIPLLADVLCQMIQTVKLGHRLPQESAPMHTAVVLVLAAEAGQRAGLHFQPLKSLDKFISFHFVSSCYYIFAP